MRIALLSGIHGNLAARETVLHALDREPLDAVDCLGDAAATGPQPREVLAKLCGLGCPVVMGTPTPNCSARPGPNPTPTSSRR